MGRFIEGLWDHEGYGARRLADGTLTGTWTWATRASTGFVAACGCGWSGEQVYLPTEEGEEAALGQWEAEHATPLLDRRAEQRELRLARALAWLGDQAGQLQDPTVVARVGRTLGSATELAAELQRDRERHADGGETERER